MDEPPPPPPPPPPSQPPPPPYGTYPQYTSALVAPKTNPLAIVSLVLGVIGCSIIAIVLGLVARSQIGKTPNAKGRGMATAGIVLGALWFVGGIAFAAIAFSSGAERDDSGAITDAGDVNSMKVKVGDCINNITEGEVASVDAVPCREPHDAEAYASVQVPGDDLPELEQLTALADQRCGEQLQAAAPAAATDQDVEVFYLHPTEDTWDRGDREIVCFASYASGPRAGSIRGG